MLRILLASTTAAALLAGGALAQSDTKDTKMDRPAATQAETVTPKDEAKGDDVRVDTVKAGDETAEERAASDEAEPAKDTADTAATEETVPIEDKPADTAATATGSATTGSGTTAATADTATTIATPTGGQGFLAAQAGTDMLASKLIGQAVINPQDEKVGSVDDLVMDQSGRVTAAVIGVGGFLGMGEKNVGVPIEALEPRQTENGDLQLMTMLTKEELEAAPEFVDLDDQRAAEAADRAAAAQQQTQPVAPATNR